MLQNQSYHLLDVKLLSLKLTINNKVNHLVNCKIEDQKDISKIIEMDPKVILHKS